MFKSSRAKFWEDNLIKPEFFIKENFVVFKTYYNEDSACYEEFKVREKSKDKCIDTILKAKNMRTMGCEYADL